MKKIFAVSDIHGHATLFRRALANAGFNEKDPEHLLVCLGDCFDRGPENRAVLDFLNGTRHKVIVRGNHEDLMLSLLKRGRLAYHDCHNGTDMTAEEFFGRDGIDSYGNLKKKPAVEKMLRSFIGSMADYFETRNYVFTHGWIPVNSDGKTDSWRRATPEMWKDARFSEWMSMYRAGRIIPRKTIVCGHRSTEFAAQFDTRRRTYDFSPFHGDGMIAIDACTVRSGEVNILVLEDELLPERKCVVSVDGSYLDRLNGIRTKYAVVSSHTDIRLGDTAVLTCESEPERTLCKKVTGTYLYKGLTDLAEDLKPRELGFPRERRQKLIRELSYLHKGDALVLKLDPLSEGE